MASGIESEPVDDNMSGIEKWIHAGKRKKRMSKRDRKKSSSAAHHVSLIKLKDEIKFTNLLSFTTRLLYLLDLIRSPRLEL